MLEYRNPLKARLRNHTRDFNNEAYDKTTELSKEVKKETNRGFDPVIKWPIPNCDVR